MVFKFPSMVEIFMIFLKVTSIGIPFVNMLDALVFACLGLMLTVYDMMITLLLTLSVIYAGLRN